MRSGAIAEAFHLALLVWSGGPTTQNLNCRSGASRFSLSNSLQFPVGSTLSNLTSSNPSHSTIFTIHPWCDFVSKVTASLSSSTLFWTAVESQPALRHSLSEGLSTF